MIGKKIKKIREQKGLTLSECAQRANISKSYLSNIERNLNQNPSILIIDKLATVLEVDLRTLLGREFEKGDIEEKEWNDFLQALKETGIAKEELPEYQKVIEFVKWQNEKDN